VLKTKADIGRKDEGRRVDYGDAVRGFILVLPTATSVSCGKGGRSGGMEWERKGTEGCGVSLEILVGTKHDSAWAAEMEVV
jgi:hypothetical protein